jgi:seryl-tRNA synthetase
MFDHTIELERALPRVLAGEFAKRIFFADERIGDFRLVEDGELTTAVVVSTEADVPTGELAEKLMFVLRNDVLPQLARAPKVVWRSAASEPVADGAFDRLVAGGAAYPVGEGQIALGHPLLALMDRLDRIVTDIVLTEFDGTEYRYPTLIPIDALKRCGYFTSFPQFVMFASRLRADVDTYREFLEFTAGGGDVGADVLSRCAPVDYCLPPTMCYHTFNQFTGRTMPAGLSVYTAKGKSFRHEARYHRTLARLWDFTIREIVFIGDRDRVLDARKRFLTRTQGLVDALGMTARCEVATDPFFANVDASDRTSSQRLLELKYELQADIGTDDSVAVASFNFHEQFFGTSFELRLPEHGTPFSGCVGFGLERLAFALVCQHGTDPAGWPAGVRATLDWPESSGPVRAAIDPFATRETV